MLRCETIFGKDELKGGSLVLPMLTGEPPQFSMHEKAVRDKACSRCQIVGCAKAFDDKKECDVYGKPTMERAAKMGKNDKYKLKVDKYRKEKKQEALDYPVPALSAHVAEVELSDADYSALVQSLIADEDDVEAEFSMLKCSMIEDEAYFEEPRIETSDC